MTAEQREKEEAPAKVRPQLVQKFQAYLRAHFDEKSVDAMEGEGTVERLLHGVGIDWLVNRGLKPDNALISGAVREALDRYKKNWEGKKQGEDDRSHALGRKLEPGTKEYSA